MPKTYPDVGTFTSGQILTAAKMNEIGDNLDNFRSPAACKMKVKAGSTITFPSGAYLNLCTDATNGFTTGNTDEVFDTDGMISLAAGAGSGSITINTAGIYVVTAAATSNVDTSRIWSRIIRDRAGTQLFVAAQLQTGASGSEETQSVTGIIDCNANDKLQFLVRQEDGVNRTIYGDNGFPAIFGTVFSAVWIGATS